jgi:hypothetical protein
MRITRRVLWLIELAAVWFSASPARAQSILDLSNGAPDVLYARSSVLDAVDHTWRPLSAPPTAPKTAPFEFPKSLGVYESERAPTNSLGSGSVQPVEQPPSDRNVHWKPMLMESLLYTGIMHSFDIVTEAGTRDTLNGHWFQHYTQSVSELRGWSDSDHFMAPYAGHPIEGSVFGFIFRQNDPRYYNVQWGDGRDYFISILRSMAYSAVWHTQWKIGPVSEASIGNVMLHASPGFITLTDTPTLGALTMMAEDAADRYVIMGLENRTDNRVVLILTRCFLNPGRSFANLMAFRPPWTRDTRLGLFGQSYEIREALLNDYKEGGPKPFEFVKRSSLDYGVEFKHTYPKAAPIELAAFPVYESFLGGGSCIGGGGSGATRLSPTWQLVAEVDGCLVMHMPNYQQSGDSLFYGAGPRWTPRASKHFSPYAEVLFGGRRVTHEIDNLALRQQLMKEWNDGNGTLSHYPKRSDWSFETSNNGPCLQAGGGLDVVVTRPFAWRLINVKYTHTWVSDVDMIHPQDSIKITTEAVLRIGTW